MGWEKDVCAWFRCHPPWRVQLPLQVTLGALRGAGCSESCLVRVVLIPLQMKRGRFCSTHVGSL